MIGWWRVAHAGRPDGIACTLHKRGVDRRGFDQCPRNKIAGGLGLAVGQRKMSVRIRTCLACIQAGVDSPVLRTIVGKIRIRQRVINRVGISISKACTRPAAMSSDNAAVVLAPSNNGSVCSTVWSVLPRAALIRCTRAWTAVLACRPATTTLAPRAPSSPLHAFLH